MSEIRVLVSGAFRAAYRQLAPAFERASGHTIVTEFGGSLGDAPTSIPSRMQRGERFDAIIMARAGLDRLAREGHVVGGSCRDLAGSRIGAAVREGAPRPDLSTAEAFRRTLLAAKSIAYSTSASGVYLVGLFERMGLADTLAAKTKQVSGEPVGRVVARGDAEIGFQQVSELVPVKGIDYIGPLPDDVQEITVFSAGITTGCERPEDAGALIRFLCAPEAAEVIRGTGMERA